MIDALRAAKSGTFFALTTPLSTQIVGRMFDDLRRAQSKPDNDLFRHVRVVEGQARWSAIAFRYEQPPAFLPNQNQVREVVCGFMMLVEYGDHVAVFKSRLEIPAPFRLNHFGRVAPE